MDIGSERTGADGEAEGALGQVPKEGRALPYSIKWGGEEEGSEARVKTKGGLHHASCVIIKTKGGRERRAASSCVIHMN